MKKRILTLLLVVLCTAQVLAQGGWQFQNPNPTGNILNGVHFPSSQVGYAVGNFGTIIKTVDGGNSWSLQYSGFISAYSGLFAVYFTNVNTGYVSGGSGVMGTGMILKTTNGGLNWVKMNQDAYYPVFGLYFVNDLTGFAAGSFGRIYKTTNAGVNWSIQIVTGANLGPVFFPSANTGYVSGNDSAFFKTTNGGTNWFAIKNAGRNYNGDLFFVNDNTGYCCTWLDGLKKTTNGGTSWFNSEVTFTWSAVYFLNPNTGFVSGNFGEVKKTTDGGASWIRTNIGNLSTSVRDFVFSDTLTGVGVGYEGLIIKSSNAGVNWATINNNVRDSLYSISFIGDVGYTAGGSGTVLKSTNAGLTWIAQSKITGATITDLALLNSDVVVGVGTGRKIIRTTNGGANWLSATAGNYSSGLYSAARINTTDIVAVGDAGVVMKSTNTGANWTTMSSPITVRLTGVSFCDSLVGLAVSVNGNIIRTTNAGNNWVLVSADKLMDQLNGIAFLNSNTGLAVGLNGRILKTTDAGLTWVTKTSSTIQELLSVTMTNPICYVASAPGIVYKSTNLGESWFESNTTTNAQLMSIHFNDANTGWVCGTGGTILRTTNGGSVFVQNISSEVPASYMLGQNYPNPFNPITNVKFSIINAGDVKIVVYDIRGREVQTLVNERLQPGTYEVTFDGSMIPSGVYFYRLTVGEFSETRKMVLIK